MNKKKSRLVKKICDSPINYFSDLFIVATVLMWIAYNFYSSIVATIVTISSIGLSYRTGADCINTDMWVSIADCVAKPLEVGGAVWMIKNSVQHAIAKARGKNLVKDFPQVDNTEITSEVNNSNVVID